VLTVEVRRRLGRRDEGHRDRPARG
jgi:hypothetical protein